MQGIDNNQPLPLVPPPPPPPQPRSKFAQDLKGVRLRKRQARVPQLPTSVQPPAIPQVQEEGKSGLLERGVVKFENCIVNQMDKDWWRLAFGISYFVLFKPGVWVTKWTGEKLWWLGAKGWENRGEIKNSLSWRNVRQLPTNLWRGIKQVPRLTLEGGKWVCKKGTGTGNKEIKIIDIGKAIAQLAAGTLFLKVAYNVDGLMGFPVYRTGQFFVAKATSGIWYALQTVGLGAADKAKDGFLGFLSWGASSIWSVTWIVATETSWKTWAIVGAVAGGYFALSYGGKIMNEVINYYSLKARVSIGAPDVEIKCQRRSRLSNFLAKNLLSWLPKKKKKEPIFNQDLERNIKEVVHQIKTIRDGKDKQATLPNLTLVGPPGTGKSMVSKYIAREADCSLVKMRGPALMAYDSRKWISEFNKIMKFARGGDVPTIIFIDEADTMLADREKMKGEDATARKALVDTFLSKTGDSRKVMVILTTNHPENLDPAVSSRSPVYRVDLPDYNCRLRILKQNIDLLFEKDPQSRKLLSDWLLQQIAGKTANLSGRTLNTMVNALRARRNVSGKLTVDDVWNVANTWIVKGRREPGSQRSWRIIEFSREFYYGTLARILYAVASAFQSLKGVFVSPAPVVA